jgi:hypothetical protein
MDPKHHDEDPIGPDLSALERRLSAWRPSAGSLDRDRMLYDAGRASAAGGASPWRLAATALLLISMGLGGALIHQRSALAGERSLLAQERAHRRGLETALAARAGVPHPTPHAPSPSPASRDAAIEAPAPNSYLVLTARMAAGIDDLATRGAGGDPARPRSSPDPAAGDVRPAPLRPTDIRRVLDF